MHFISLLLLVMHTSNFSNSTVEQPNDSSQIKFFHWNSHSIVNKKEELQKISADYDIIVLMETWLKPDFFFSFGCGQFNVYRLDRDTGLGGGIAFLIRKTFSYELITDIDNTIPNLEICGIRILNLYHDFDPYKYFCLLQTACTWTSPVASLGRYDVAR